MDTQDQDSPIKPFGGISRGAIKRRARRHSICKCGKSLHDGLCPKNQTNSQYHVSQYIKLGLDRFKTEHPYFQNVDMLAMADTEARGEIYLRERLLYKGYGNKARSPEETPEFYAW